jgi:formaldehyde-activating enzyme involved in methanogenesis
MFGKVVADFILDDEVKKDIVAQVNKSVNIPMINEKTEAKIFEALWEIFKVAIKKKLGV